MKSRTPPQSKKGFTLIELIITIGLFSVLVAIGIGGFTSALHTQRQISLLLSAQSNVSIALEQMAREVRTGYLFCHDVEPNDTTPAPACGCLVGDSGVPAPPGARGALITGDLPIWTCTALDFFNAESDHVTYDSSGGALRRGVASAMQAITSDNVSVKYMTFTIFGNMEGDSWTPRVTITMGIAPNSTDPGITNTVLNLQTTVSARSIDCTTAGVTAC